MFCIVAFLVLAVLSVFSVSSRGLAKEALACVLRRVTLRPCTTGFDEKIKARMLGSVLTRSEAAARLLNKNFELLSWGFFLLMLVSSVWLVRGVYFFYVTGSCNSSADSGFCLFDPKGTTAKLSPASDACPETPPTAADLTLKGVDLSAMPTLNRGGKGRIVMIGCYGCSYSRKVYPLVKRLAQQERVPFVFVDYPVKVNTDLMSRMGACVYRQDEGAYWKLNDLLFQSDPKRLDDPAWARRLSASLGLDSAGIGRCMERPETKALVRRQQDEILKTGFYGTPTIFVNGKAFVGPKPYRVYAIALKGPFYWLK